MKRWPILSIVLVLAVVFLISAISPSTNEILSKTTPLTVILIVGFSISSFFWLESRIKKIEEKLDTMVAFTVVPDRVPTITVEEPKGRPLLPPGTAPKINFTPQHHVTE